MSSEAATLDAPETTTNDPAASQPQQPMTSPVPPEMKAELDALMKRVLPMESDTPEAVDAAADKPAADTAAATAVKAEPGDKAGLRLAPDLTEATPKPAQESLVAQVEKEMPEAPPEQFKTPKAQNDYKAWRTRNIELAREVERLKTLPPAAPEKTEDPGTAAIIERQTAQITELSTRLERQNLQEHPLFQQQFVQPRNQMFGQALEVVKEAEINPEAFERAMTLTGKGRIAALDEIVKEVDSTVLRTRLERLIDGIDTKDREIAAALKDSKGLSAQLKQQETIQRHEQMVRQERQLTSMLEVAQRNLAEGFDTPDGGKLRLEVLKKTGKPEFKWWDDQVDDIIATSKEILLKGTPQKMAVAATLGAACGAYQSLYHAERTARLAAESRLAAIEGAEPDLGDRGKPKPVEGEFAPDEDIVKVAMAKLRRGDFGK